MAAVKRSGTKLELHFERLLEAQQVLGVEKQVKRLPGTPDFAIPSARVAIFLDSCFWHGCPLHCRQPKTRTEYWTKKIANNIARDHRQSQELHRLGWAVVRIWEHELKQEDAASEALGRVTRAISGAGSGAG